MAAQPWGEDPSKWVIQKSKINNGWIAFPPYDGEPYYKPTFDEVVAALW